MTSEDTQKPQNDEGASKNTKANGNTSDANSDRVLTVDILGLRWPEQEDREEVGAGDEGNDERED